MASLPAFTPPATTHALGTALRAVRFRHPAYPGSAPDLLVLMAADSEDGLDFDLALTSCCIVADTHWDHGYLAQKAGAGDDVLRRVDRPQDGLLRGREYFFCVEGHEPSSFKYRFWFVSNRMDKYCRRPLEISAINDGKNILILRKDVYHLFDARRFTFLPKRFGTCASESTELVTHVLLPSGSPELVGLYHNRSPQPIRGISVECLFARFAWSLFTDEHIPFFGSGLKYAVRLWDEAKGEAETRTLRGLDVKSKAQVFEPTRSQSRSVSPKKRSLSTQAGGRDDGDGHCLDDGDDIPDEHDCDDWDEPPRGRPLKRRWETLERDD